MAETYDRVRVLHLVPDGVCVVTTRMTGAGDRSTFFNEQLYTVFLGQEASQTAL